MIAIEATTPSVAIATLLPHVSIKDVLTLLAERADTIREEQDQAGDKFARARAAQDHRHLVNLREKIYN